MASTTFTTSASLSQMFASASFPEMYERMLVPFLFKPWAERLVERVPIETDARKLDVACGTGIVCRTARSRVGASGKIVAVDKSPAMLEIARSLAPDVEFREGAAEQLPLLDGKQFDVVLCQQGVQFFADRAAALRGMRAALAPGGRVGIAVWRSLEENGLFGDLDLVARRNLGPIHDARHGFPDPEALRVLLVDAGFKDVNVEPTMMVTHLSADPAVLIRMNANAVVGMSEAKSLSDADRAAVVNAVVDASLPAVTPYVDNGVVTFPTSANIATAHV